MRLARLVSIAGRIEPQFIRALRLHLASDLTAEAEADLWFSNLVQTRAATGISLAAEHQRRLRDELAAAGGRLLTRVWELLFRLRTDHSWDSREQIAQRSWLLTQEEIASFALKGIDPASPERAAVEIPAEAGF